MNEQHARTKQDDGSQARILKQCIVDALDALPPQALRILWEHVQALQKLNKKREE